MKIFAIADLHLSNDESKPMSIFGPQWEDHFSRICADWKSKVSDEDIVLLPGDLSWEMKLENALSDIRRVGQLPGRKVLIRGNHDYWWSSISRVREVLPEGMYAIQNDALTIDGVTFCGTRGWILPGEDTDEDDDRIRMRELGRLRLSMDSALRVCGGGPVICMLHYPPLLEAMRDTEVTALIEDSPIREVVYGHLHGNALKGAFRGIHNGVHYHQVSCDGIGFKLEQIMEINGTSD